MSGSNPVGNGKDPFGGMFGPNSPFGKHSSTHKMGGKTMPKTAGLTKWFNQFNKMFQGKLTWKEFQKFLNQLNKGIVSQIKQEETQAKKASQKLKDSEEGKG